MDHPFQKEVLTAKMLAQQAGEMAKLIQAGSSYSLKMDGEGPVSNADLLADEIIVGGLRAQFPLDLLISEESSQPSTTLPQSGRVWMIDPIDGTADYIIGGQDYSVMIGLLIDGIPRVGVVYGPETGETWVGVNWSLNGSQMRHAEKITSGSVEILDLKNAPPFNGAPIIAVSKHHASRVSDQIVELLRPSKIIRKGSLGLKMALIAESKADVYAAASRHIKAWDTCAPFALLHAAGGATHTFDGKDVSFGPTCTHTSPFFAVSHRCEKMVLDKFSQHLGHYAST